MELLSKSGYQQDWTISPAERLIEPKQYSCRFALLMIYQIIEPPFTLAFWEMSRKDLKKYSEWFHRVIPERIKGLILAVKSTPGYEKWEPDCSPQSLEALGEWFLAQAEARPRTQEEIDAIRKRSKFPIGVAGEELTDKTFSLAMDIGMYISQVFLKNHPSLQWSQPLGNKKSIDYGRPVLISFNTGSFNPIHMMVTLAYGLVSQAKHGKSLRDIYDIWSKLIS